MSSRPTYEELEQQVMDLQGEVSSCRQVEEALRKRAEKALKASEEKYRHLLKHSPTGIYEVDFANRRLKSVNDVICRVLGYTEEELLCMNPLDLLDEDGKRTLMERIRKSLAGEKVDETAEYKITAKDGRKLWTVLNNAFVYEEGRITGSLVVAYDITERKRVEEALRESEEKFRSLVETTSDWIWEADSDGVYTYASPRVRDLLGYEPEEVLGRKPFEFMPPDESDRLKALFSEIVKGAEGCIGLENVNIRKDGRRVVLETSCVPRLDGRGNLLGYRGIDRDITDRKRAEEVLQRSHHELELRVQERTAELERRNQELQNFTFAAAHDLQEPLRKIQTFSDLLRTKFFDSVSDQGRKYIERMHETATRMRDVIQSLIKYSRLTSRTGPFGRIDLNRIAREVVSDFELQVRETGALVEIGDLPEIEADAGQMKQLLQLLLENALKFRRQGIQPIIKIHADCRSQSRECELFFNDNGIGFDEKFLDLIFKPFQRLHGNGEYNGIGMGLAICAKVVENHKGRITAKSTPGQGSIFVVNLPVNRVKERS